MNDILSENLFVLIVLPWFAHPAGAAMIALWLRCVSLVGIHPCKLDGDSLQKRPSAIPLRHARARPRSSGSARR